MAGCVENTPTVTLVNQGGILSAAVKISPGAGNGLVSLSDGLFASSNAVAVVATSIAGLGAAVDGKIGILRLGSSPYDFVRVVYDATYGKWVSDEKSTGNGATVTGIAAGATVTINGIGASSFLGDSLFATRVAAGLSPQGRILGSWAHSFNDSNPNLTLGTSWQHVTIGASDQVVYSSNPGGSITQTIAAADTLYGFDTGWVAPANPASPKSNLIVDVYIQNSSGQNAVTITWELTQKLRWVG